MPKDKDFSLHKSVAIARSGVYQYHVSELAGIDPSLIPVPKEYEGMTMFNVYRPASVVEAAAPMFSSKPLVLGHTETVHPANWRELVVGHTGSDVKGTYDAAMDEITLTSDVTIGDQEALEAYYEGIREVSPWYNASFSWRKTKTRDGQECQIVMDRINEVNNVAMLSRGRGGRRIKVADSERSATMRKSSIFYSIAKSLGMVKDGEGFVARFQEAVDKRKTMTAEQLTAVRDELTKVIDGFPETENRNMLSRYVFDLPAVRDEEESVVKVYGEKVVALFGTLDAAADEEYEKISEATKKEAKKEGEKPEQEAEEKKENKEEKKAADGEQPEEKKTADSEVSEEAIREYARFKAWEKARAVALKGGNVTDSEMLDDKKATKDGEKDLVDSLYQTARGGKK